MYKETLINEVRKFTFELDGKLCLHCHDARRIAEELKTPYSEIGKLCNEEMIKIKNCELGCF